MSNQIPNYLPDDVEIICEGELGRGSYGVVKKANCMGKPYAIKYTRVDNNFGIPSDVLREVDISRRFIHPNLVHNLQFKYLEQGKKIGLVLPVAVDNLYSYRSKITSDVLRLKIFSEIASGLSFLHEFNVLYLDMKLENILIFVDNNTNQLLPEGERSPFITNAVITDFGLSLYCDDNGRKTYDRDYIRMTPVYIPPELKPRKRGPDIYLNLPGATATYTKKCDVWALGILALELYNPKWKGFTNGYIGDREVQSFQDSLRKKTIISILGRNPGDAIVNLLYKMLSPNPHERPDMNFVNDELLSLSNINVDKIDYVYVETKVEQTSNWNNIDLYRMYQLFKYAQNMDYYAETVYLAADLYHQCRVLSTDSGLILAACTWIAEKLIEYHDRSLKNISAEFGRSSSIIKNMEFMIMQYLGGIIYRRYLYYYTSDLVESIEQLLNFETYHTLDFSKITRIKKSEIKFKDIWIKSRFYQKLFLAGFSSVSNDTIDKLLIFLEEYVK